jgi:hypothetical protein
MVARGGSGSQANALDEEEDSERLAELELELGCATA